MFLMFLDESGDLGRYSTISKYYAQGGVIIDIRDWSYYEYQLNRLKKEYGLNKNQEVKMFHLMMTDEKINRLENKYDHNPLASYNQKVRLKYGEDLLRIISNNVPAYFVYHVCNKEKIYLTNPDWESVDLHVWSVSILVDIFQRFLEIRSDFGLVIKDQRSQEEDIFVQAIYDWSLDYLMEKRRKKVLENLLIVPSRYSIGIQYAEFCAGAVFQKYAREKPEYFNIISKKCFDPRARNKLCKIHA